jgi:VanZ family protein
MRQVTKIISPIIVLLGILLFPVTQTKFASPISFQIAAISAWFLLCKPLRTRETCTHFLLFWTAPLALLWLLSERKEGRDIHPASVTMELILAGIGTAILVSQNSLKKEDTRLVLAIMFTWAVAYFSGSTGGADRMHPLFDFLGLTVNQLNNLIIVVRKTIHLTFYGAISWLMSTYLLSQAIERKLWIALSFCFPLLLAVSDEFRQSMMPNRQGSFSDVILDMSATLLVLFVVDKSVNKKRRNSA